MAKSKYKRLVDLYVTGTVHVLKDGTPLWLQVMNPFERETVRREAQVAQARQILAMKEHGSEEQVRVKAGFYSDGRDGSVDQIIDAEMAKSLGKIIDGIRDDPEWSERLEIHDRGIEDSSVLSAEEELLLGKIEADFFAEIGKRSATEREFLVDKYAGYDDEALWEAFLELWLDRLGSQQAMEHYRAGQLAYGARACEGVLVDGEWDHAACGGHEERVWETYEEVRSLPESLRDALLAALGDVEMTDREAKNSDRQMSSSGSSQLPSEVEASTPSTSTETLAAAPGTSPQPSPTLSPSSDGSSSPTVTSHPATSG